MYEPQYQRPNLPEAAVLRAHCQVFSRMGWALFAQMLSMVAVQSLVLMIVLLVAPDLAENAIFLWCLSVGSAYGIGVPVFCLIIRGLPAPTAPQAQAPLGPGRLLQVYLVGLAGMYLANYATLLVMFLIGLVRGEPVANPVDGIAEYPAVLGAVLGCVVAPVLEELVFRHLLLRRLRPYGEKFAMLASALAFGLFHGNFHQIFYAFMMGLVLAYVVLKTGCLWQAILLHAMANAVGTVIVPLMELMGESGMALLGVLILAAIIAGVALFAALRREIYFLPGQYGFTLGRSWRLFFENPGMVCFCLLTALMAGSYLVLT